MTTIPRSRRSVARLAGVLGAAVSMGLVAAMPASAATVALKDGNTTLRLNSGTAAALTSLGVSVKKVGATQFVKGTYHFPVSGGAINPATAAGIIDHKGGLALRAGKTKVFLTNFRIQTTGSPRILAKVNGSRAFVHVFNLDLKSVKLTRPGINTRVSNVDVTLSKTGAAALAKAFSSDAFVAGLAMGKANVLAKPATVLYTGGGTELAVDSGTLGALTSLGITPSAAATSTLVGALYTFPITKGSLNGTTLAGTVDHTGGIVLTKGATVVTLSDFTIDTTKKQLWGKVNGSTPVAILDLDLSKIKLNFASRQVWVSNVPGRLTAGAASALNGAFSTTGFSEGLLLGTARIKGETA